MMRIIQSFSIIFSILLIQPLYAFDHQHKLWHAILQENVHMSPDGLASRVDYQNIKNKPEHLQHYLQSLSSVKEHDFQKWSKNKQKAFLINAYNAFTIQLVLTRYPDIESIKDIGSFFRSPWKKKFFLLLNKKRSLDDLEHKMLRKKGIYDDPFIHVSLVCASTSCPALIKSAYTDITIEKLLLDNMQKFLSDKSRNHYNSATQSLEVSKIFDWYEEDFKQGYRGIFSLHDLFSRYSKELSNDRNEQKLILAKKLEIDYLNYDWSLNNYKVGLD